MAEEQAERQASCFFSTSQLVSSACHAAAGSSSRQPGRSAQELRRRCGESAGSSGACAASAGAGVAGGSAVCAAGFDTGATEGGAATGFSGVARQARRPSATTSAAQAAGNGSLLQSGLRIAEQRDRYERIDVVFDRSRHGVGFAGRYRLVDLAPTRRRQIRNRKQGMRVSAANAVRAGPIR